jgi:hypothetical protein
VYLPDVDKAGHSFGPNSDEYLTEARLSLERIIKYVAMIKEQDPETVILITADHGHIGVSPSGDGVVMLNQEFPGLEHSFELGRSGRPLLPAGSLRDRFLHVREEEKMRVFEILKRKLEGRVAVHLTSDLIQSGIFESVTDILRHNIGNITLLPLEQLSVHWMGFADHPSLEYRGDHGGMTPEEMEIPFLCIS